MPQETNCNSIFSSPGKSLRGLKSLASNNEAAGYVEEIINDHELAHRKAEEAGICFIYLFFCFNIYIINFFINTILYALLPQNIYYPPPPAS